MKKTIIIVLLAVVTLMTISWLSVYVSVVDISIIDNDNLCEYYNSYGISSDAIAQKNIKEVSVKFKIFNGRFKSLNNINVSFDNNEANDGIIVSKTDTKLPWSINVKPLTKKEFEVYFLVDSSDLSDEEIIEKLNETYVNIETITMRNEDIKINVIKHFKLKVEKGV